MYCRKKINIFIDTIMGRAVFGCELCMEMNKKIGCITGLKILQDMLEFAIFLIGFML